MPLQSAPTSYLRTSTNFSKNTVIPQVAAERVVFIATCVKRLTNGTMTKS